MVSCTGTSVSEKPTHRRYGITSHVTIIFIVTAERTSNACNSYFAALALVCSNLNVVLDNPVGCPTWISFCARKGMLFFATQRQKCLWHPPSLLSTRQPGLFSQRLCGKDEILITHLGLLEIHGAIPPLVHMPVINSLYS